MNSSSEARENSSVGGETWVMEKESGVFCSSSSSICGIAGRERMGDVELDSRPGVGREGLTRFSDKVEVMV